MTLMPSAGSATRPISFPVSDKKSPPIVFFNRHTGNRETERIFGEWSLRHVYETRRGNLALFVLWKRALASRVYGTDDGRADSPNASRPSSPATDWTSRNSPRRQLRIRLSMTSSAGN